MSLDELLVETGRALSEARRLFGSAPADTHWSTSPSLGAGGQATTDTAEAVATRWQGAAAATYMTANSRALQRWDKTLSADAQIAPAITNSGQAAASGARSIDSLIAETRSAVAAFAPSVHFASGRSELASYLRRQLTRAHTLLRTYQQLNSELAATIHEGSARYDTTPAAPTDAATASPTSWKPSDPRRKPIIVGPGNLGPAQTPDDPWIEVGPRSGIWVPKNELPGVTVHTPDSVGPPNYAHDPVIELIPGSGVWAPEDNFPHAIIQTPGTLGPPGPYTEWLPGSGIWMPSDQLRPQP
ncbi:MULTISPECIES: DUF4226 domain-containing protein [Mycobacterium ulcerans group]|nr:MULTISPECIES: DUF4226 domain-containing protein [Mycobacterium ulcerans group]